MEAEEIAYWYFRLNGFLTIPCFILHPSQRGSQRTDADLLGVRFPYRLELPETSDDPEFLAISCPHFIIAEIKHGPCDLNGPWVNQERQNINAVLQAIGLVPLKDVSIIANSLYQSGTYTDSFHFSLFCVGRSRNDELSKRFPNVPQKIWDELLAFIFTRFRTYRTIKRDHEQWDSTGKELWNIAHSVDEQAFVTKVKSKCGLI